MGRHARAVAGPVLNVQRLQKALRQSPASVAVAAAAKAAPYMTTETRTALHSGRTVYDETRPASVDGGALSLRRTGAMWDALAFAADGRLLRTREFPLAAGHARPTQYVKYLIGRYRILPNGPLPLAWQTHLRGLLAAEIEDFYGVAP